MAFIKKYAGKRGTTYRVRWKEGGGRDGKEVEATFDYHADAVTFKAAVDLAGQSWPSGWRRVGTTAVREDERPQESSEVPLFADWATQVVDAMSGIEPYTRGTYRSYLTQRLVPAFGHLRVNEVQAVHIGVWINELEAEGRKPKTIANYHGLLFQIIDAAVRHEPPLRSGNPCKDTRLPRRDTGDEVHDEMVFLTYPQYQLIRSHAPETVRDMLDVAVGTGLRFAELTALQVGDVDVLAKPHPMLRVRRAWKTDEKGRRAKLGPPKTRRSRRTVQLTPELAEILIPHVGGRASDEFVFTSPGGKAWWRHNFYNRCWKPAVDEAMKEGLEARPRIHDLRHTHVSWLIARGVQLTAISRRLGHESITTTIDRYGHLLPEVDDGLVKALAVAMDG
jgi:integrase